MNNFYRDRGERGGVHGGGDGARDRINEGNRPPNGNAGERDRGFERPGPAARPFNGDRQAARGYGEPRGQSGVRSGAFGGYDHGGQERGFSQRGGANFGGGGGFQGGGGGGSHGGGGGHR